MKKINYLMKNKKTKYYIIKIIFLILKKKEKDNKLLIDHLYSNRDYDDNNEDENEDKKDSDINVEDNNDIRNNKDDNNEDNKEINKKYNKENKKNKKNNVKEKGINLEKEEEENENNNILLSKISPYKGNKNNQQIPERDTNNLINNNPIDNNNIKKIDKIPKSERKPKIEVNQPETPKSKKNNKKVSFDDHLVYINYDEDEYVTNLQISDKNGKPLPYKEKDISKYLRLLTSISHTSKLKPAIIDLNKKPKSKKKTRIMQRNMDFIKKVEKTGHVYNTSKEKPKKKYIIENMQGCKKFLDNPQQFFTEDLCDAILLQYNLVPKEEGSRSSSAKRKKSKDKK